MTCHTDSHVLGQHGLTLGFETAFSLTDRVALVPQVRVHTYPWYELPDQWRPGFVVRYRF